jgi:hypothetical protein
MEPDCGAVDHKIMEAEGSACHESLYEPNNLSRQEQN